MCIYIFIQKNLITNINYRIKCNLFVCVYMCVNKCLYKKMQTNHHIKLKILQRLTLIYKCI